MIKRYYYNRENGQRRLWKQERKTAVWAAILSQVHFYILKNAFLWRFPRQKDPERTIYCSVSFVLKKMGSIKKPKTTPFLLIFLQ